MNTNIDGFIDGYGNMKEHDAFGYNVTYITKRDAVLCPDCASEDENMDELAGAFSHFEGTPLYCDDCDCEIESIYGDPDEIDEVV